MKQETLGWQATGGSSRDSAPDRTMDVQLGGGGGRLGTFLCLSSLQFVHRRVTSTTLSNLRTVGITERWRGGSLMTDSDWIDFSTDSLVCGSESSLIGAVLGDSNSA
jgi:hypothetical protein